MKWISSYRDETSRRFQIELDEKAGFYLYVYEGDLNTHDYLQDTIDSAMRCANRLFGVPTSSWHLL